MHRRQDRPLQGQYRKEGRAGPTEREYAVTLGHLTFLPRRHPIAEAALTPPRSAPAPSRTVGPSAPLSPHDAPMCRNSDLRIIRVEERRGYDGGDVRRGHVCR